MSLFNEVRILEEFEKICRPVVEYIQKNYGASHVKAIISCEHAELVKSVKGVPFKFLEQDKARNDNSA